MPRALRRCAPSRYAEFLLLITLMPMLMLVTAMLPRAMMFDVAVTPRHVIALRCLPRHAAADLFRRAYARRHAYVITLRAYACRARCFVDARSVTRCCRDMLTAARAQKYTICRRAPCAFSMRPPARAVWRRRKMIRAQSAPARDDMRDATVTCYARARVARA